ncbi:hypothetical protein PVAND_016743 [Polypedilum vanderplanki]|uniref:Dromyosuppressin n=1 Tax=Polypedilum vanderplanki TaxID=319348 RepID=A0A9J6BG20_POLVA|nr:hypothetical protein PVAND_016743 [Polypedilum vanderplanki]
MQNHIVIISLAFVVLASLHTIESTPVIASASSLPPLCEPGIVEELPTHIKKVCAALLNSNQLSSALTQYIRSEAAALMVNSEDLANNPGIAGKRTDVDHVFLRFGRR